MAGDKPFDAQPTTFTINPGGRLGGAPAAPSSPDGREGVATPSVKVRTLRSLNLPSLQVRGGLSDLVPFLVLATRLRLSTGNEDPRLLLRGVQDEIGRVFALLPERGWEVREAQLAKFFVCCTIDNAALNGPLAQLWATNQLASTFFKSASGGTQFFGNVTAMLSAAPGARPPQRLFELAYLCLVCGFEGRYGVNTSPREAEIDGLKTRLLAVIGEGGPVNALGLFGSGIPQMDESIKRTWRLPVWPFAATVVALCLGLLFAYRALLGVNAETALARLEAGAAEPLPQAVMPIAPPPPQTEWIERLRGVAGAAGFAVSQDGSRVSVIASGGLFASASDRLRDDLVPVYQQIGTLLNETRGSIVVRGHTDRQPMRSLQFRSNRDLARARAKFVGTILASSLDDRSRVYVEAVGETEPLCLDSSAACHARNRRVEVTLDSSR